MLRLTPNVTVWRPCDFTETAVAWKMAIEHKTGPCCLLLTRQNVPQQQRNPKMLLKIKRGGYILFECKEIPEAIIIATGSEVALAIKAAEHLTQRGRQIRVVSMPSTTVFDQQEARYRDTVLPPKLTARVAVEAGASDFWYKYVGAEGKIVGINRFGESAPAKDVYKALDLTVEQIIKAVKAVI